jgi:AcrR family transcriptional regulator
VFESDHPARNRMVSGAADLLGRRGLAATTVRELASHTGAPLGSTYHYFPGGKTQLAAEAVRWADEQMAAEMTLASAAGPAAVLDVVLDRWRATLADSDFQRGCAVLAVAVHSSADDAAPRDAAVFAFSNWTSILAGALRDGGAAPGLAADTATLIIAAVEGAVAMSRAERSLDPLDAVARRLHAVLAALR